MPYALCPVPSVGGTGGATASVVTKSFRLGLVALIASVLLISSGVRATVPNADASIRRFLAQGDVSHSYRAHRRLEAENGDRSGWVQAQTEYSSVRGLR